MPVKQTILVIPMTQACLRARLDNSLAMAAAST
jgi:hypothetical protein